MGSGEIIESNVVSFLEIDEQSDGQRLDNFLLKQLKKVPKSKIYRIIRKGEVRVNKGRCKPETRLSSGDIVRIPPVRMNNPDSDSAKVPTTAKVPTGKAPARLARVLSDSLLFEDDKLLVINKPQGIAVHGGSGLSFGVIEILRAARSELRFLELVHRLDRDTSGVLMLAKKRKVLVELHSMLQTGRVVKTYHAWVNGQWPAFKHTVTAPLRKNTLKSGERIVVVAADGKPSETTFEPLLYRCGEGLQSDASGNIGYSLVKASPLTGRTHQIRVHCQFAGHPVLGDEKYCPVEINQAFKARGLRRMCLHAQAVMLDWPGQKTQTITAPWSLAESPVG